MEMQMIGDLDHIALPIFDIIFCSTTKGLCDRLFINAVSECGIGTSSRKKKNLAAKNFHADVMQIHGDMHKHKTPDLLP